MEWHVITSEYPPQAGGVSDYTKLVSNGLAGAGDEVHVWCPAFDDPGVAEVGTGGSGAIRIHRDLGRFAPAELRRVGSNLDQFAAPRRLLVQWVPQGYGYRSLNLPFCFWLWSRAKLAHDRVEIMVHEPFLPFAEGSPKQDLAAAGHRLMVSLLLKAASHVWVSIPDWETQLRPYAGENKSFSALPVPSTISVVNDPAGISRVRAQYAEDNGHLIGHFGAYDHYMTALMSRLVPVLINRQHKLSLLLIGKGSLELRDQLLKSHPELSTSIHSTGSLSAKDISRHVGACDVMLQPYQDGVSGRRTSVMTALSHGVPVVTNEGKATESCWAENQSVALTPTDEVPALVRTTRALLNDAASRLRLKDSGRQFYETNFALSQIITRLRAGAV